MYDKVDERSLKRLANYSADASVEITARHWDGILEHAGATVLRSLPM
jgi:hypothetical protein